MSAVTDVDGNPLHIRPNRARRRQMANDMRRAMSRHAASQSRREDRKAAKARAVAKKAARTAGASS